MKERKVVLYKNYFFLDELLKKCIIIINLMEGKRMSKEQSVKPVVNHLQVIEKNTERFLKQMGIKNKYFCIISPYYQNAFSVDNWT